MPFLNEGPRKSGLACLKRKTAEEKEESIVEDEEASSEKGPGQKNRRRVKAS